MEHINISCLEFPPENQGCRGKSLGSVASGGDWIVSLSRLGWGAVRPSGEEGLVTTDCGLERRKR